jgi:isocitrate/isopropylmalate dehydrogenase
LLLPAIDLLEAEGHPEPARRLLAAVEKVLEDRRALPADLGGTASTSEVAEAIIAALSPG